MITSFWKMISLLLENDDNIIYNFFDIFSYMKQSNTKLANASLQTDTSGGSGGGMYYSGTHGQAPLQ